MQCIYGILIEFRYFYFSQDFSEVVSGQIGDEQAALNKILHKTAM